MPLTRIFQPSLFSLNTAYSLDERASHHLTHVLRATVNEQIILFNGKGGEYQAHITQITKKSVSVMIDAFDSRDTESLLHIHLAQGIARGEKMDWIIQKSVELGVQEITPLSTERSNVRLDREREQKRLQHWQYVAISACEQSGRTRIPLIHPAAQLSTWIIHAKADCCFVLVPSANRKLSSYPLSASSSCLLLIGPEGGLSDAEISLAQQNHFNPLHLGPRILRTETASLAAIAMLQSQYGDLR